MQRKANASGWPEFLYYTVDEPHNNPALVTAAQQLGAIIRQIPGARIFITGIPSAFSQLDDYVDVRCFAGQFVTQADINAALDAGDEVWTYLNPPVSFEIADYSRLYYGIYAWRLAEQGVTGTWSFIYQSGNGDIYQDMDVRIKDWAGTYPTDTGPLDTVQWENVREGIDDFRYLSKLQNAMVIAQDRGGSETLIAEAQAFLQSIRDQVPVDFSYDLTKDGVWIFENAPDTRWYENIQCQAAYLALELLFPEPQSCGDPRLNYLESDINKDCYVDLADVAMFMSRWLDCNETTDENCN